MPTALASGDVAVGMHPRATYLHTSGDAALMAIPIIIADVGFEVGQTIRLERLGDFDPGPGGDTAGTVLAVFSASGLLLPATELHRVRDAIDAGADVTTGCTHFACEPTDIPEDFLVATTGTDSCPG